MTAIDRYIAELDSALRGPRRARVDLLTETRDSLHDAAAAYEHDGLDRIAAEQRAVREFGDVDVVAPDYQTELSLAQSRRTALITLLVVLAQPLVWNDFILPGPASSQRDPGPVYALLGELVEWLGGGAILGSALAVLACGIGVRYLGAQRRVARITGTFTLSVCVLLALSGIAMTAFNTAPIPLFDARGIVLLTVFLLAPLVLVAASAHRCLRSA